MSTGAAFVCAKDMAMSTSTKPFSIAIFQDGSVGVVHSDPRTPRVLEVIAIFSEAERARDYADRENSRSAEHTAELTQAPTRPVVAPAATAANELSARQSAVLGALRSKMDANKQVAVKAAVLAEAAQIPLGSLHSVLQSLEKKRLITTVRAGSARAPALHQVLTTLNVASLKALPRKHTRLSFGGSKDKAPS
jgi:DNA-binding MarR family transcriptional regulator